MARTFSGRRQAHRVSGPALDITLYLRRPWPLKPNTMKVKALDFSLGGLGVEIPLALKEDAYILLDIQGAYHQLMKLPAHILYCSKVREGLYRCGLSFILTKEPNAPSLNREALHLLSCIEKHQQAQACAEY